MISVRYKGKESVPDHQTATDPVQIPDPVAIGITEGIGQSKGHSDRDHHAHCKHGNISRLDRQNTRQAAYADGTGCYTGGNTEDGSDAGTCHAADKREDILQVNTEHCRLGDTQVTGDAGRNIQFLRLRALLLQKDHAQYGGTLCAH